VICGALIMTTFTRERYTNIGIVNGDGQTSVPEAAVLGRDLETDVRSLPGPVADFFGYALYLAQDGKKHEQAKPL
jgi:hypothetical protein